MFFLPLFVSVNISFITFIYLFIFTKSSHFAIFGIFITPQKYIHWLLIDCFDVI